MASLGTYAYALANAPFPLPTDRYRALQLTGTGGGDTSLTNPTIFGDPAKGQTWIFAWWAPWDDPLGPPTVYADHDFSGMPGIGSPPFTFGAYGTRLIVQTLGSAPVVAYDVTPMPSTRNFTYSGVVSFSFGIDEVTEFRIIEFGDPTVYVYVEGVPRSVFGGNGMPDGPPGITCTFFETALAGATASVSATVNGTTAATSIVLGSDVLISNYAPTVYAQGGAQTIGASFETAIEWAGGNGGNPGFADYSYSEPTGDGTAALVISADDSGFTVTGAVSNSGGWQTNATASPPIARRYRARASCGPDNHPGPLSLSCDAGSVAFAGGAASIEQNLLSYTMQGIVAGVTEPLSALTDAFVSARMWLSNMAHTGTDENPEINDTDDRHDHFLPIAGAQWVGGNLSHAETTGVLDAGDEAWSGQSSSSGSGIVLDDSHTSASASRTFPANSFEAYRFFRIPLTLTAGAPRKATITLANAQISKSYDVDLTPAALFNDPIDSQVPFNVPSGFNVDRRSSRYPILDQVGAIVPWGPLAGAPDEGVTIDDIEGFDDDPESVKGWLWGANSIDTVTVSCPLAGGESLLVGALDLVRVGDAKITLANEFTAGATGYDGMKRLGDERAVSGGAIVAQNFGGTHALVRVDDRWLDLPSVWRRVPVIGATGPVFMDVSAFLALFNAFQGLTMVEAAPPSLSYADNSAFGLFLACYGWIVTYGSDGVADFEKWFEHSLGDLIVQELFGDVIDYPGMGNPLDPAGEYGFTSEYGGGKDLRTRAEGRVFDPTTRAPVSGASITTADDITAADAGDGTTNADGLYKSGLNYWFGNGRDFSIVAPAFTDDPRKGFNRRRVRASFLKTLFDLAVHLVADRFGQMFATQVSPSDISVRKFDTQGRDDTFIVATGIYKSAQSSYSPSGLLECHYDDASGSFLRRSRSSGKTWEDAVSVGAGLASPAPVFDKNGVGYVAYYVSGDWQVWAADPDGIYSMRSTIVTEDDGKTGLAFRDAALRELVFAVKNRLFISTNLGFDWNEI